MTLPKLLGSYEAQLHGLLEEIVSSGYTDIIELGCGEGYYALGLASRMPARVHAFDLDPLALQLTAELAVLNQVSDRVHVRRGCSPQQLKATQVGPNVFILSDCEGAEAELIDPQWLPWAEKVHIMVECHNTAGHRHIAEELMLRFSSTHEATLIKSEARRPAAYPMLSKFFSGEVEMILSESRPPGMQWPENSLTTKGRGHPLRRAHGGRSAISVDTGPSNH